MPSIVQLSLRVIALSIGLVLSTQGFSEPSVKILSPKLSGNCASAAELKIEKFKEEYFIKVMFNGSMSTLTNPGVKNLDTKRCTIDFSVAIDKGLRFESFTFNVDGVYQLSKEGTGRVTVSNVIGSAPSIRSNMFYSIAAGDQARGDLLEGGISGSILAAQIDPIYRGCGAKIGLETSIFTTVNQPPQDKSGVTLIDLDSGTSKTEALPGAVCNGAYCIGKLKVRKGC